MKTKVTVQLYRGGLRGKKSFHKTHTYIIEGFYSLDSEPKDFAIFALPEGSKYYEQDIPGRVKKGPCELWICKAKVKGEIEVEEI